MNEQEHLLGLDGDLTGKIQGETEEELEPLEGQLLPPKAAGKAVARFRQDPEQPAAPALSLIPPPQQQPGMYSTSYKISNSLLLNYYLYNLCFLNTSTTC